MIKKPIYGTINVEDPKTFQELLMDQLVGLEMTGTCISLKVVKH